MRQPIERRPAGRSGTDFIVDGKGHAQAAKPVRRSPLWTFAILGVGGVALTAPELPVGEAILASGRAVAHGGGVLIASARAAVYSAAEMLRKRSPGARTSAHLIKTKAVRSYAPRPVARAKPRLRPPVAPPPYFAPPEAVPLAFADQPYAPAVLPIGGFPVYPFAGDSVVPCYCAFGFVPPIFGGGGLVLTPPGGGGGENPPPTVTPPAVPEPQSWAMMILGFGVVGTAWRRRRSLVGAIRGIPRLTYAPLR